MFSSSVHNWREDSRLPPTASVVAASPVSQLGAPGRVAAFLNHSAALDVVVLPPVMHEADVLVVLPVPIALDAALEQRDRLIRPARPARRRLRQEQRAESIRHLELRIERGHEIEERKELVVGAARLDAAPAAVINHRANPVDVGRRSCRSPGPVASPLRPIESTAPSSPVRKAPSRDRERPAPRSRPPAVRRCRERAPTRDGRRCPERRRRVSRRLSRRVHLKSLRPKIVADAVNRMEM